MAHRLSCHTARVITEPDAAIYMGAAAMTAFALGFSSDDIVDGIANYEPKPVTEK